jgi:hypothetical protein
MSDIWKFCGLKLKNILIQQEFNFIGKESNFYTGKENEIVIVYYQPGTF